MRTGARNLSNIPVLVKPTKPRISTILRVFLRNCAFDCLYLERSREAVAMRNTQP